MLDEALLKKVIGSVLKVDPASIGDKSSNESISTWDSVGQLSIVIALEDEFDVAIPDAAAQSFTSYPLVRQVMQRLLESR
jgi:acyl carrier protein